MFDAYGWIRVRSSYDALAVNPPSELVDKLDDEISRADNELWDKLEAYLTQYGVESDNVHTFSDGVQVRSIGLSSLKWSFHRQLNNLNGLLTLVTSCNHRCRDFVDLLE